MDSFSTQNIQNIQNKQNNTEYLTEDYSNTSTKFKSKCKRGICCCFSTLILLSSYALVFYIGHTYGKNNCNSTEFKEFEL